MESSSHVLTLNQRQSLEITGVKEVKTFDPGGIELVTALGPLVITGTELLISNLDLSSGLVSVSGKIDSIEYLPPVPEKRSFLSGLFGGK
ncbi:MAG: sporulation protein YabP [Clostridia bacterium]|nr:sporulation protein YabP [Clostridia bacterium]